MMFPAIKIKLRIFLLLFLLVISTIPCVAQIVDSITDVRDGQVYRVVKIGEQWWLGENLNYGIMIDSMSNMTDNEVPERYCYNNDTCNCDTFGALYQWDEMMQYSTAEGVQGLCPAGWHVPSDEEWKTLEQTLGISAADADSFGWRGTDQGEQLLIGGSSGFELLFAGHRHSGGDFYYKNQYVLVWTASLYDSPRGIFREFHNDQTAIYRFYHSRECGNCVRCLADSGTIVPVELNGFLLEISGHDVLLSWNTESEKYNLGFNVMRSSSSSGEFIKVNTTMIAGAMTTSAPNQYQYVDTPGPGIWYYKLEQIDMDGTKEYSKTISAVLNNTAINLIRAIKASRLKYTGYLYDLKGSNVNYDKSGIYFINDETGIKKILLIK